MATEVERETQTEVEIEIEIDYKNNPEKYSTYNSFENVMIYILNQDPSYVYNTADFTIYTFKDLYSIKFWKVNITEPTLDDLKNIENENNMENYNPHSSFENVMIYILKQDPSYVYNLMDFAVYTNKDLYSIKFWKMDIKKPNLADLINISEQEKIDVKTKIENDEKSKLTIITRLENLEKDVLSLMAKSIK